MFWSVLFERFYYSGVTENNTKKYPSNKPVKVHVYEHRHKSVARVPSRTICMLHLMILAQKHNMHNLKKIKERYFIDEHSMTI